MFGEATKKTKVPVNAQRHHKQRLRDCGKMQKTEELAEEFVINLSCAK